MAKKKPDRKTKPVAKTEKAKPQPTLTKAEIRALRRQNRGRIVYPFLVVVACLAAGVDYIEQRKLPAVHPSFSLTKTRMLSDYLSSLRHSRGDTEVYIYEGRAPGGTVMILGGTHPNEPASNVTATLMAENILVHQGRVIIVTCANASGFSATEPQEAFPPEFRLVNRRERERKFRVGSRFTNILDGWPDPVVYRHHPSGQTLSGNETRNLNRAYPGRENGTLTERVAWAITKLVEEENVDLLIDLHEAAPEYPVVDAIVAHEKGMDVAAMATAELQALGLEFRLEPSPVNFHGLSHREIGDFTSARTILLESTGALQGRIRGATDEALIIESRDPMYQRASELGKLQVEFPAEGVPLEIRVGRHLEAIDVLCDMMSEFYPELAINYTRIPDFESLQSHGIGFYLK